MVSNPSLFNIVRDIMLQTENPVILNTLNVNPAMNEIFSMQMRQLLLLTKQFQNISDLNHSIPGQLLQMLHPIVKMEE